MWLSCLIAVLLALPYLGNTTAYVATTSLSTISLYISYVLPVVCKLLYPHTFYRGPFHLGRLSTAINVVAVLWVCVIMVLFVLPPVYPVTAVTMNYASVGVGGVFVFAGLAYLLSARYWFRGPITTAGSEVDKSNVNMNPVCRISSQ